MRLRWKEEGCRYWGWKTNVSADSAAASRAALTFSERMEEGDQVNENKTEEARNT